MPAIRANDVAMVQVSISLPVCHAHVLTIFPAPCSNWSVSTPPVPLPPKTNHIPVIMHPRLAHTQIQQADLFLRLGLSNKRRSRSQINYPPDLPLLTTVHLTLPRHLIRPMVHVTPNSTALIPLPLQPLLRPWLRKQMVMTAWAAANAFAMTEGTLSHPRISFLMVLSLE